MIRHTLLAAFLTLDFCGALNAAPFASGERPRSGDDAPMRDAPRGNAPAGNPPVGGVPFEEFDKIVLPRGPLWPLDEGRSGLLAAALPGDPYPKLYELRFESKEFRLRLDPGKPVKGLWRDRQGEGWYFNLDEGGDENYALYAYDLAKSTHRFVYGHPGFRATVLDSSPDGKSLFVLSNHEDKAVFRVYRVEPATGKEEALTGPEQSFEGGVLDSAGERLALAQAAGNNEVSLWLLDLRTRALKKVFGKKDTVYEPVFFHPKRPELYLLSDEGRDRVGCAKVHLLLEPRLEFVFAEEGKDVECSYSPAEDVSLAHWSYEGRKDTKVFLGALDKELRLALPEKSIVAGLFRVRGKDKAIVQLRAADNPGEYYETRLKVPGKLKAVSKLNRSAIEPKRFAKSWDLYYPSFDGRQIHGIIYAPEEWVRGSKRRPAIVWPHGGPDWSESHDFRAAFQFWALNGFVVFAPNFRGSLGYGKAFETLNDGDWGGGHIKDLLWGKNALEKLPYVDPDRIFIAGGSFGGYSVLSAISQYPREFKAAAAYVALANLFTFLKSIPPDPAWQAEFRKEVGDPVQDEALLKERSPFFHAGQIVIPLKIWQAENDVRTVKAEMDSFTTRLKELGIPVEYVVLPQEGHGLSRKESLRQVMEGTVEFFRKSF